MELFVAARRLAKADPEAFAVLLDSIDAGPIPKVEGESLLQRACRYAKALGSINGLVITCRRFVPDRSERASV